MLGSKPTPNNSEGKVIDIGVVPQKEDWNDKMFIILEFH